MTVRTETIQVSSLGHSVVVREVTNGFVKKVLEMINQGGPEKRKMTVMEWIEGHMAEFLSATCENLSVEEFWNLTGSETEALFEAIKKVNTFFLKILEQLKVIETVTTALNLSRASFMQSFVSSLPGLSGPATQALSDMDGSSHVSPSVS